MTFDEALGQLDPRTIWDPEMRDLLEQLRKTYAPTVEMTQKQYDQLKTAKELTTLMSLCNKSDHPLYNYLYPLSGEKLATAWLHPECIKVVDSDAQES